MRTAKLDEWGHTRRIFDRTAPSIELCTILISPLVSATVLTCASQLEKSKRSPRRRRETHNHLDRIAERRVQQCAHDLAGHCGQLLRRIAQQHRERQDTQQARGKHQRTRPSVMTAHDAQWHEDQQPEGRAAGHKILQSPPLSADVLRVPRDLGVGSKEDGLFLGLAWGIASAAAKEPGC